MWQVRCTTIVVIQEGRTANVMRAFLSDELHLRLPFCLEVAKISVHKELRQVLWRGNAREMKIFQCVTHAVATATTGIIACSS